MTDRKSIETRIAALKTELAAAEGTPTEVYSRIVGYYRSVRNWNVGKREEYRQRLAFAMPGERSGASTPSARHEPRPETAVGAATALSAATAERAVTAERAAAVDLTGDASLRDGVLVFTREACPNCSPVANYVIASGMKAVFVDVDRAEGFALARDLGVMATPTVLGLDAEGKEAFRAFDVKSLRSSLGAR